MTKYLKLIAVMTCVVCFADVDYNHPEFNWSTIETEHFKVHFHDETESTAREAATVAEEVYDKITMMYDFEPKEKTHLVLTDPDDISNGAAYYYDNKIVIYSSPLDFALRGSHRWLQNVITHEFVHYHFTTKVNESWNKNSQVLIYSSWTTRKRIDLMFFMDIRMR